MFTLVVDGSSSEYQGRFARQNSLRYVSGYGSGLTTSGTVYLRAGQTLRVMVSASRL